MSNMPTTSKRLAESNTKEQGDIDTPMEPEGSSTPASHSAAASAPGNEGDSTKKVAPRKRRRGKEDGDGIEESAAQKKRTRLMSPNHSEKDEPNDMEMKDGEEDNEANSEEEEMQMKDAVRRSSEKGKVEPKKTSMTVKKPVGSKSTTVKKRGTPSLNQKKASKTEASGEDMAVPNSRVIIDKSAPAVLKEKESGAQVKLGKSRDDKSDENGSSAKEDAKEGKFQKETECPRLVLESSPSLLEKPILWFLFFLLLHGVAYGLFPGISPMPFLVDTSTQALKIYKKVYFSVVASQKKKIVNQTIMHQIIKEERERHEQKKKWINQLREVQQQLDSESIQLAKDTQTIEDDLNVIKSRVEERKFPVLELRDSLDLLEKYLNASLPGNVKPSPDNLLKIRQALSEGDKGKLIDITSVALWEIPPVPDKCGDGSDDLLLETANENDAMLFSVVVPERLKDWQEAVDRLVSSSTNDVLNNIELEKEIQYWLQSDIKESVEWDRSILQIAVGNASELLTVNMEEKGVKSGGETLVKDAILAEIQDRLEIDIADHTGEIDYASLRNGAYIIRKGPRATSRSLIQSLPFFNRVLSFTGLRFYGYGAEAALTPTDPPDALGQCWAFQNEETAAKKKMTSLHSTQEFSRGSFATLTVRLAKPVYVHSVVIEHPPLEVANRMESAVRIFRVIGYEDVMANEDAYELGRFEYKLGK